MMLILSHSVVSDSATPWTAACQAPLSMGFSMQEYWSGLPFFFPSKVFSQPRDQTCKSCVSCTAGGFFTTKPPAAAAAAAAAKSLQSCPTLCDPRDGSPPGSSARGIFQARGLEWVAIAVSSVQLLHCCERKCKWSRSVVPDSLRPHG